MKSGFLKGWLDLRCDIIVMTTMSICMYQYLYLLYNLLSLLFHILVCCCSMTASLFRRWFLIRLIDNFEKKVEIYEARQSWLFLGANPEGEFIWTTSNHHTLFFTFGQFSSVFKYAGYSLLVLFSPRWAFLCFGTLFYFWPVKCSYFGGECTADTSMDIALHHTWQYNFHQRLTLL